MIFGILTNMKSDIIVIGAGPAGLTAGIYCARAGRGVDVYAGDMAGGQLMFTNMVENYPGFEDGIMGADLMSNMVAQAEAQGVRMEYDEVVSLSLKENGKLLVSTENSKYHPEAVIITTGKSTRWLGIEGEKELIGKGISSCAVCDGSFFKDKVVGVVGGGDTACEEALYLSHITKEVHMFVRKDKMRASEVMIKRVEENPNIRVHYGTQVISFRKNEYGKLSGVMLSFGGLVELEGLFVAIGREPNISFLSQELQELVVRDGHIIINERGETPVKGLFAAGDITNEEFNQAIIAAGQGAIAGLTAIRTTSNENTEEKL